MKDEELSAPTMCLQDHEKSNSIKRGYRIHVINQIHRHLAVRTECSLTGISFLIVHAPNQRYACGTSGMLDAHAC